MVRLSASRTGHLYRQDMFLVLIFTRSWVDPRAMVRSEGICHWKIQWHHREPIPGPSNQKRRAFTTTTPQAPTAYTAHEKTIRRSPPINNFTADRKKNLTDPKNRPTYKRVRFLRKYRDKQCSFVDTTCWQKVFVIQLSSNAGISVWLIQFTDNTANKQTKINCKHAFTFSRLMTYIYIYIYIYVVPHS